MLTKAKVGNITFWYQKNDRFVGNRIAMDKYEKYETKLIIGQINKDSVVVDVGANIGYYTVLMAQSVKKVYAIEPEKNNFEILLKNIKENNLINVVPVRAAVGKVEGKMKIFVSEENYGDHRLYNPENRTRSQDVECMKLDDILKNEAKIDLIKIDTQGWEPDVIEGGKKLIERDRPTIFMEYWPSAYSEAGLDGNRMMSYLQNIYKNIWRINDQLNCYSKISNVVKVDEKSGYADLWMKNKSSIFDLIGQWKELRIQKLMKKFLRT